MHVCIYTLLCADYHNFMSPFSNLTTFLCLSYFIKNINRNSWIEVTFCFQTCFASNLKNEMHFLNIWMCLLTFF